MTRSICVASVLLALWGCSAGNADNAPARSRLTFSIDPAKFADTFPGSSRKLTISVENTGQVSLTVTITQLPAGPFAVVTTPALPATIAPQESILFEITFSPAVAASFATSLVVAGSGVIDTSATLPVEGVATFGTVDLTQIGGFWSPAVTDSAGMLAFAASGPDLVPGTADDILAIYDPFVDSVVTFAVPAIVHAPVRFPGRIYVPCGGVDGVPGTADDEIRMLTASNGVYTWSSAVVGALAVSPICRPLTYAGDALVIATGGPDLAFGSADDTLAVVKFSPLAVSHATVGALDASTETFALSATLASPVITFGGAPSLVFGDWIDIAERSYRVVAVGAGTATIEPAFQSATGAYVGERTARLTSRPHSAANGYASVSGPGVDGSFGTADDTISLIEFNLASGAITLSNTVVAGALDPVLSEVRLSYPLFGSQVRPGPDGVVGSADDRLVGYGGPGVTISWTMTIPNLMSGVEILSQPLFFVGSSEYAVLSAGVDAIAGTADDEVHYVQAFNTGSGAEVVVPVPNLGPPSYSRIAPSSWSGGFDPLTKIPNDTMLLLAGIGADATSGTADDEVILLHVTAVTPAAVATTTFVAGPLGRSNVPQGASSEMIISSELGADGLPASGDEIIGLYAIRRTPPESFQLPIARLAGSAISAAVPLSATRIGVLTTGPDGVMNTADDEVAILDFPEP